MGTCDRGGPRRAREARRCRWSPCPGSRTSLGALYAPLAAAGKPQLKACIANCGPSRLGVWLPKMPRFRRRCSEYAPIPRLSRSATNAGKTADARGSIAEHQVSFARDFWCRGSPHCARGRRTAGTLCLGTVNLSSTRRATTFASTSATSFARLREIGWPRDCEAHDYRDHRRSRRWSQTALPRPTSRPQTAVLCCRDHQHEERPGRDTDERHRADPNKFDPAPAQARSGVRLHAGGMKGQAMAIEFRPTHRRALGKPQQGFSGPPVS